MPCDYRNYPPDWKQIRARILERAGHKCEECGLANYQDGWRMEDGSFALDTEHHDRSQRVRFIRIVLTVAHLNHDTTNNDPENLRALCQRCHLLHDREHHAANAARTRDRNRGQTTLALEADHG